jgi:uncharacterized protein (TIGR02001 family)
MESSMTTRSGAVVALLAATALALPATVEAQELSWGATITSDYISSGVTNSDNKPALQGYVELESGGFYAGAWASTVRGLDNPRDRIELDLYLGFRNTLGAVSYDVSYARYFYNRSGDCCGEFLLSLDADMAQGVSLGTQFKYDPDAKTLNSRLGAAVALNEQVEISGGLGRLQRSHNYWDLGANYALTDNVGVDLRYHDNNLAGEKSRAVLSVSFDF